MPPLISHVKLTTGPDGRRELHPEADQASLGGADQLAPPPLTHHTQQADTPAAAIVLLLARHHPHPQPQAPHRAGRQDGRGWRQRG